MDLENTTIKLVYITDLNYVMPTITSITSVIKNAGLNQYKIYVITTFEDEKINTLFYSMKKADVDIEIVPLDLKNYVTTEINTDRHVSTSALIKFFLPDILAEENKILYLDGDTIIRKPLDELFNTDIGDNYAGVVFDSALTVMPQHAANLKIPPDKYFNSGVMLLNLQKMRNNNLPQKFVEYKINGQNFFMDQDAFNIEMYNNIKFMPVKYNMTFLSRNLDSALSHYLPDIPHSRSKRIKEAVILHFADRFKPWLYNRGELTAIFMKYLKMSPYKNKKLKLKDYENKFLLKFLKALIKEYII